MRDLYLSAPSRDILETILCEAGILLVEEESLVENANFCFDWIGPISKITGMDSENNPVTTLLPDYHLNIRVLGELTEEQEQILGSILLPTPTEPYRVWAS